MIYMKMTRGWVAQQYDSETGDCIGQQFIAEEDVQRQYDTGEPIPAGEIAELENTEKECPFDMVQP
jgi:hypothetical protein